MSWEALDDLLILRGELIASEPGPRFMAIPERWYDEGPLFRCTSGHVSSRVLKSEELGRYACLAGTPKGQCLAHVVITFPEDVDDPR